MSNQIGGKAKSLELLKRVTNVPNFFVIPITYFEHFLDFKELFLALENGLSTNYLDKLDLSVYQKRLNPRKRYIIRSSANIEDGNAYSFAGMFESYVLENINDFTETVKKVLKSVFSNKVKLYLNQNQINDTIKMAVIVQEYITPTVSFIINTINPFTSNPDEIMLSGTYGECKHLVNGLSDATNYFVNLDNVMIDGKNIISESLLKRIVKTVKKVQSLFNHFQDIELVVQGKKIYVVQSRDIANYKNISLDSPRNTLDNANIIESYNEPTTPLTYSFAKDVYYKVYKETLTLASLSKKKMTKLEPYLQNMIYSYNDLIYYNLNSWYVVNGLLPSSKKKIAMMENMMGVNTKLSKYKRVKLSLFELLKVFFRLKSYLKKMDLLKEDFLTRFHEKVDIYKMGDLQLTSLELLALYDQIEKDILPSFTIPIINDTGLMIYYGLLKNKLKKKKYITIQQQINKYINNNGNVKSAVQNQKFIEIIDYIKLNPTILKDFLCESEDFLLEKFHHSRSPLYEMVHEYIYNYGGRVAKELMLETKTFYEEPSMLYKMLKLTLLSDEQLNRPKPVVEEIHIKNKSLLRLIKNTKAFIQRREELRLKRTDLYSCIRRIFIQIGKNLYKENIISSEDDIFYYKKEEIIDLVKNGQTVDIQSRKECLKENKTKEIASRIVFYGPEKLIVTSFIKSGLTGIPSGAAKVTGKIVKLDTPDVNLASGKIVVASRTDPGWIVIYVVAKGLIVENGSALSHSMIVAREMSLPAIVNVKGANEKLKDGMIVTLDSIKGEIIIEKDI